VPLLGMVSGREVRGFELLLSNCLKIQQLGHQNRRALCGVFVASAVTDAVVFAGSFFL